MDIALVTRLFGRRNLPARYRLEYLTMACTMLSKMTITDSELPEQREKQNLKDHHLLISLMLELVVN